MVASAARLSVCDLYVEAVALKVMGLSPRQITDRLVDLGHDNGFANIRVIGAAGGGRPDVIELQFPTGEVIDFDGAEWHHRRP